MADFAYNPDLLSQLQAQLRAATASGLPWVIDNAQRAYDYAKASGADLPFDAKGEPIAGAPALPPVPQATADANAQTGGAIVDADPAVFAQPPPPPPAAQGGGLDLDGLIANANAGQLPGGATPAATPNNPPTTPAAPTLEEDPAYQAFVRALGSERATAERNTGEQVDAANRSLSLRLPQIADAGNVAREGISGGYETRGLLHSGQHEVALSRQRQAEGNQASTATDEAAQRVATLRQGLASQEVGFDSRLAEQNLAASGRLQASHDAQTLANTEQQSQAALLAEQRRANDLEQARFLAATGQPPAPGATPAAQSPVVQRATDANPVGVTGPAGALDPNSPDYIAQLIAQMQGR